MVMVDIWIISDTHFGHRNIVTWSDVNGAPLRPWDTIEEHDQAIADVWRTTVKQTDKIYHLGDVALNIKNAAIVGDLPGRKRLILGNHDSYERKGIRQYAEWFQQVAGSKHLHLCGHQILLTHIPAYLDRWSINLHGHLHEHDLKSSQHVNCCLEKTGFAPIHIEDAIARAAS